MNARRLGPWLAAGVVVVMQTVAVAGAHAGATNALVSTLSASRQFTACANDRLLPSALCVYADHVKREWLRCLDVADNWRDPIILFVRTREESQLDALPISMIVFQTDTHFRYQIQCFVPPRIDEAKLRATIIEALCSEWANRQQTTVRNQAYTMSPTPVWLVQGMAASMQGRQETLLAVAQRSVAAGRPPRAADLLEAKSLPVDPLERQLFQASAWMLMDSLRQLPEGARKLRDFLSELGAEKNANSAFWVVYHADFPQGTALEKWWSLELIRHTWVSSAQDLTVEDTAGQLDAILVTKLSSAGGHEGTLGETDVAIEKLAQYADAPWLKDVLKLKIDRLGALRSRAHPLYQPVLDKYIEAVIWLHRGSAVRFRRAVNAANAARAAVEVRSRRVAAYLDQAESVNAPEELTKAFTGYFQTLDQFQKLDTERRSPISDYLDKFDH
jgi:hypothetical protein